MACQRPRSIISLLLYVGVNRVEVQLYSKVSQYLFEDREQMKTIFSFLFSQTILELPMRDNLYSAESFLSADAEVNDISHEYINAVIFHDGALFSFIYLSTCCL